MKLNKRAPRRLGSAGGRPRVVIVYKSVPQYRVPFYDGLRVRLASAGIELELVYGQPTGNDATKEDSVHLPWAIFAANRIFSVGPRALIWQPILSRVRNADLVIVEQASKLLVNYVLLLAQRTGRLKVAFWGHGKNFQTGTESAVGEAVKRVVSKSVHWWFAYNQTSVAVIKSLGFPDNRITSVQNSIDTTGLAEAIRGITTEEREEVKARLGIGSDNVGIFCGGLYPEKRLPFLFEAGKYVRDIVPDFELLVLGSGPDKSVVAEYAEKYNWIHAVGPVFGADRAPFFSVSKVMLLPGLVGLAVLDAFVCETPLIAVDVSYHSPEVEYLQDGVNGLMLPACSNPHAYGKTVGSVLIDESIRSRLVQGCRHSAQLYTIENMVERFAAGIELALRS